MLRILGILIFSGNYLQGQKLIPTFAAKYNKGKYLLKAFSE